MRREEDAFVVEGERTGALDGTPQSGKPRYSPLVDDALEDIELSALRNAGIKDGDTVRIAEWEFEYLS